MILDPNIFNGPSISRSHQIGIPRDQGIGKETSQGPSEGEPLSPQPADPNHTVGGNPWSDWEVGPIESGVDPVDEIMREILGASSINEMTTGTGQPGVQQAPNIARAEDIPITVGGIPPLSDPDFTHPSGVDMAYNTFVGQPYHLGPYQEPLPPVSSPGTLYQDRIRTTFPEPATLSDGSVIPQNAVIQSAGIASIDGTGTGDQTAVISRHPELDRDSRYNNVEIQNIDTALSVGANKSVFRTVREVNAVVHDTSHIRILPGYNGEEPLVPEQVNLYIPEADKMVIHEDPNWVNNEVRKILITHEDILNGVPGADPPIHSTYIYIASDMTDEDVEEYMQNNISLIDSQELIDTGFPMEVMGTNGEIQQTNLKFEQVPDENGNTNAESIITPSQLVSSGDDNQLIEFPEFGTIGTPNEENTTTDTSKTRIIKN